MNLDLLLHGFFTFLGTTPGELAKKALELILFIVVSYMIISEWTRNKTRGDLKFLIIAFLALAFQKLIAVYILSNVVFVGYFMGSGFLFIFENLLEIFAIFLVANAFVYPIVRKKGMSGRQFMKEKILILAVISIACSLIFYVLLYLKGSLLVNFWTNTSILIAEVVVLLYYAGYILKNNEYRLKYRVNLIVAFVVYTITPLIKIYNIMFHDFSNSYLIVAAHPFPFISILIFTQVIFLKLVDKATLKQRLKKSVAAYRHEKEVSELKDEFISTVSHELRTPLTSMKLYVSLLKNGKLGPVTDKQRDALVVVDSESNRLKGLINDILDLSKLESGKVDLNISEFNLYDLTDNKLHHSIAEEKGISVKNKVSKKLNVSADQERFCQVFINLLNNSVKFTPEGGAIVFNAGQNKKNWWFELTDNGKGIEKEKIPRLFEKFYQTEQVMTRTGGGVGLGLAIVKKIVDLHKGYIDVNSKIGKGTSIRLEFPHKN